MALIAAVVVEAVLDVVNKAVVGAPATIAAACIAGGKAGINKAVEAGFRVVVFHATVEDIIDEAPCGGIVVVIVGIEAIHETRTHVVGAAVIKAFNAT